MSSTKPNTNRRAAFIQETPAAGSGTIKQPTIAERFQQLDFDEAIFCFNEIKAVMKQRIIEKSKEVDSRMYQIKEFCSIHNI